MRAPDVLPTVLFAGCSLACGFGGKTTSSQGEPAQTGQPAPRRERGEPVAKVSAIDLFNEYGQNMLAADKKYKGKLVEVSGWGIVQKSEDGRFYMGFEIVVFPGMTQAQLARLSPRERQWFRDGAYPPNVLAYLNPEGEVVAADYKRGDSIRAVGFVKGTKKADVWRDHVLELEDCELKPVEKTEPIKSK